MNVINMVELTEKIHIETARSRKAIVWGQVDVLAQAVRQFLMDANATWDVIRVPIESGIETLVKESKRLHPDVVILCQESMDDDPFLPIRLIEEQLCPRVVTIEILSNHIQVYSRQLGVVQGASDFLSIVENGIFPDCTHGKEVDPTEYA
jgi:hypothetical protein